MNKKVIVAVLAVGLMACGGEKALAAPVQPSDIVTVFGAPLTTFDSDPTQFFPAFAPAPGVADGAVQLLEPGPPGTSVVSDQLWVQAQFFYFASDPNLVDLGPSGFNIPVDANIPETGLPQDVSHYFRAPAGHGHLPANSVLVQSDALDIPEPAGLALLGIGALGMAGYGWRKRKTAAA